MLGGGGAPIIKEGPTLQEKEAKSPMIGRFQAKAEDVDEKDWG